MKLEASVNLLKVKQSNLLIFVGVEGDVKMNLNIGQVIYELRKRHNLTQEQLANAIGVSIPAVSKWENGTTYPDITLLPIIARYFKISIDQLMDYQMELSSQEIEKFIRECQQFMQDQPFECIITRCEEYLKEYPNSDELKLSVGSLYMMGVSYFKEEKSIKEVIQKAIALLEESAKSSDSKLSNQSYFILASLYGMNGEDEKAEEVLLKLPKTELNREDLLIPIYIQQNRYKEAKKMIQVNLLKAIQAISLYLSNYQNIVMKENDIQFAKQLLKLDEELITVFNVESLLGMGHVIGAMHFYAALGDEDKTMNYLVDLVEKIENYNKEQKLNLFDQVDYKKNSSQKHFAEMIVNLLEIDPKLELIKGHQSYPQVITRLKNII